ncbi:response regulator transcription factor [Rhodospirillum centenum]|uniref:Regulatory protein VirG n=1 Tax=Rhodospirillum centenum (strain ATCC 51521 / SW) TaxID=414684 RepID=B6IYL9_RHOCS|nr:response regulator transcription factor [Rhodospirillum centenum]ACJ01393.1 two-component response regulator GltR [Rhodospirillum centenum SW]
MSIARILLVEDDDAIRALVIRVLSGAGFTVEEAPSGSRAMEVVADTRPDLAIVDLGLPDMDGLAVVRELRQRLRCGVIILSGRSDPMERIIGLEVGADDYVPKPFEPRELLARVKSVLRRLEPAGPDRPAPPAPAAPAPPLPENTPATAPVGPDGGGPVYRFEGWTLDSRGHMLIRPDGGHEDLTTGEFTLLLALVERAGRVLSRDQLLDVTHGHNTPAFDRSVDVQIARLRRKIQRDPDAPPVIRTVRNAGYLFAARVTRA